MTTFEDLTQKKEDNVREFVSVIKKRAQSVLMESPKETQIKMLTERLYGADISKSTQCLYKSRKTRPTRVLSNRVCTVVHDVELTVKE